MNNAIEVIVFGFDILRSKIRCYLWKRILNIEGLQLGKGSKLIAYRLIVLGKNFNAGSGLWLAAVNRDGEKILTPNFKIGDNFSCSDNVHIACAHELIIGQNCLLGSKVYITDHNHGNYGGLMSHSSPDSPPILRELSLSSVHIGDNVFLGDNVVVLPGAKIESGVVVGANSLVRGLLPVDTLCVGIPARPIKHFDRTINRWVSI
jgi:acetyltransferase-like isoleucine patch superfamily enzyme